MMDSGESDSDSGEDDGSNEDDETDQSSSVEQSSDDEAERPTKKVKKTPGGGSTKRKVAVKRIKKVTKRSTKKCPLNKLSDRERKVIKVQKGVAGFVGAR